MADFKSFNGCYVKDEYLRNKIDELQSRINALKNKTKGV